MSNKYINALGQVVREESANQLGQFGPFRLFPGAAQRAPAQQFTPATTEVADRHSRIPRLRSRTRNLRRGMRGSDVAEMQRTIGVPADGIFGPSTERALKEWQALHGLNADGIWGPASRAKAAELARRPRAQQAPGASTDLQQRKHPVAVPSGTVQGVRIVVGGQTAFEGSMDGKTFNSALRNLKRFYQEALDHLQGVSAAMLEEGRIPLYPVVTMYIGQRPIATGGVLPEKADDIRRLFAAIQGAS